MRYSRHQARDSSRNTGAQQIMEGMLSDRTDGSANGTGSANIAIGEVLRLLLCGKEWEIQSCV
ncbi:MAG: hypothetical protein EBU14_06680 [Acetobacteraceae bacterium]|nr:hypothetical protein [Acetobacteraceae bacterium]